MTTQQATTTSNMDDYMYIPQTEERFGAVEGTILAYIFRNQELENLARKMNTPYFHRRYGTSQSDVTLILPIVLNPNLTIREFETVLQRHTLNHSVAPSQWMSRYRTAINERGEQFTVQYIDGVLHLNDSTVIGVVQCPIGTLYLIDKPMFLEVDMK